MKKLIFTIFLILNFVVLAYDPALNQTEKLYREAKQLTTEYIASCKTMKTLAAKELTQQQKENLDAIITHNEKALASYDKSLETLKKLMLNYESLSDGERSSALNTITSQNESLEILVNSLQNALALNKAAIESYQQ